MPYPRFAAFNVAGGIGWVCLMTLTAYAFGSAVAALDNVIFIASLIILPIPLIIAIVQYLRLRRARKRGASAGENASSQRPTRHV